MIYEYVAAILLCESTAMSFLKEYTKISRHAYFLAGLLFYTAVVFFLIQSFHFEGMGMVNVIWSAFSVVFVECLAVYTFHERVTHTQIFGILFAVVGVAILRF